VAAGELGDEQRGGSGVDTQVGGDRARGHRGEGATEAIGRPRRERVGHPTARVVDEDRHRAEQLLGRVEQPRRRGIVEQVGFDRRGPPREALDGRHHVVGPRAPVGAVARGRSLVRVGGEAEVRHEHVDPRCRQGDGDGRADAVVAAGHEGDASARRRNGRGRHDGRHVPTMSPVPARAAACRDGRRTPGSVRRFVQDARAPRAQDVAMTTDPLLADEGRSSGGAR
jgi:hypothetical protein